MNFSLTLNAVKGVIGIHSLSKSLPEIQTTTLCHLGAVRPGRERKSRRLGWYRNDEEAFKILVSLDSAGRNERGSGRIYSSTRQRFHVLNPNRGRETFWIPNGDVPGLWPLRYWVIRHSKRMDVPDGRINLRGRKQGLLEWYLASSSM
jgi:hypothetical protein